mmetsp:Transcript_59170/g.135377  ORF Transcript_59170/g.135377 Transcript_59170/m.135377 type:complete len:234 (-) Transcript_59170:1-702(-)
MVLVLRAGGIHLGLQERLSLRQPAVQGAGELGALCHGAAQGQEHRGPGRGLGVMERSHSVGQAGDGLRQVRGIVIVLRRVLRELILGEGELGLHLLVLRLPLGELLGLGHLARRVLGDGGGQDVGLVLALEDRRTAAAGRVLAEAGEPVVLLRLRRALLLDVCLEVVEEREYLLHWRHACRKRRARQDGGQAAERRHLCAPPSEAVGDLLQSGMARCEGAASLPGRNSGGHAA